MNCFVKIFKLCILPIALSVMLNGCSKQEVLNEKYFSGKWKSSRVTTPVTLNENGEWKISTEDGGVLQQGVWQYKDGSILWSYNIEGRMVHEKNPLVSTAPQEFKLRENDLSITTFSRLE
jgi:hypothetical protein